MKDQWDTIKFLLLCFMFAIFDYFFARLEYIIISKRLTGL